MLYIIHITLDALLYSPMHELITPRVHVRIKGISSLVPSLPLVGPGNEARVSVDVPHQ